MRVAMRGRRWPSRELSVAVATILLAPLCVDGAESEGARADAKVLGKIRIDAGLDGATEDTGSYGASAVSIAKGGYLLR